MNITAINSQTSTPYNSALSGTFQQRSADFRALNSAIQSGNLSDAQTALTAFQQTLQGASQNSATAGNSGQPPQLTKDMQALSDAIQSGDVSSAQKALATLKQDAQSVRGSHGHHHHHHSSGAGGDSGNVAGVTAPASLANPAAGTLLNTQA